MVKRLLWNYSRFNAPTFTFSAASRISASRGNVVCVPLCVSELPMHWDSTAHRCLNQPGTVAGTFRLGLDVNHDPIIKYVQTL